MKNSFNNHEQSFVHKDSSLALFSNLGDIQSSAMKDAVLQMEKDDILHEYQYFIGPEEDIMDDIIDETDIQDSVAN